MPTKAQDAPASITTRTAQEAFVSWNFLQKHMAELIYFRAGLRHMNGDATHAEYVNKALAEAKNLVADIEAARFEPEVDTRVDALLKDAERLRQEAERMKLEQLQRSAVAVNRAELVELHARYGQEVK